MRRRIREAYRLNHRNYPLPNGIRIDLALIYVADKPLPYPVVENALARILKSMSAHFKPEEPGTEQ